MKALLVIIIGLFVLSTCGCSLASHTIRDVDKHIAEMTSPDTATVECIAGFYAGVSRGTDNLKIAQAVMEMNSLVDTAHEDYKRCKVKGLEVSILAISGKENLDDAIKKVMSLGVF